MVTPPLETPVVDAFYETAATGNDDAATLDLNPAFCPDAPTCRPVLDGTVVWRDQRHVSAQMVRQLRGGVLRALVETGMLRD